MKKILLAVFAILSILSLSACDLFSKEGSSDTLTGILTEQTYGDEYNGTHLITNEDSEVYAVNSTVLNLSSSEYVGNKVKVNVEYDEDEDVYRVSGVSVLEVLNGYKGVSELIDYVNEPLGFKLKYYSDWNLNADPDGIRIVATLTEEEAIDSPIAAGTETFAVIRYEGTSDKFFEKFSLSPDNFNAKDSIIGDDQLQAKTYTRINGDSTYVVFERSPYVYVISFSQTSTKFYEVLNSFRFIPINDTGVVTDLAPTNEEVPVVDGIIAPNNVGGFTGNVGSPVIPAKNYDFTGYSDFQSSAYGFKAKYPTRWYYDGTYRDPGVLSQYRFSDKPIEEGVETFGSLKLLSDNALPDGISVNFPNGDGVKVMAGDQIKFYVQVDGKVYLVEGSADKADSLETVAASITKAE